LIGREIAYGPDEEVAAGGEAVAGSRQEMVPGSTESVANRKGERFL
jgi:hypothetical protein